MATGEDEAQPVVFHSTLSAVLGPQIGRFLFLDQQVLELLALAGKRLVPAELIDRLSPGRRDDPGLRSSGYASCRPVLERCHERFLERVLGQLEIAATSADQYRQGARAVIGDSPLQQPRSHS